MLDLLRTYSGCPPAGLQYLYLPAETLLLFPSADTIVLLNARTLLLIRALAFWEVFPGARRSHEKIGCLTVDSAMKLIVAAKGRRIATWSLSGVQQDTWRVHSSLILPKGRVVSALECRSGLLAVASDKTLSIYTLILENDLPTWSAKWTCSVPTPSRIRFSPSLMNLATTSQNDNLVRIYLTTSGRQIQAIPHPRPLQDFAWRHAQASSRDDLILYTVTSDSVLRIFMPVIDSPQQLQLHASVDLVSSLPFSTSLGTSPDSHVFWLDRAVIGEELAMALRNGQLSEESAKVRRAKDILDEGWDLFLRVLADGSLVVRAVANIDRRPPSLLKQFTLLHTPTSVFSVLPSHLYILPNPGHKALTLVTSSPLTTCSFDPLSFFDARSEGLRAQAHGIDRIPEEESHIVHFSRTPDGKAVAVLREEGGEVWYAHDRGSRLVRAGRWSCADHVVVLDGGRTFATYSRLDQLLSLHTDPPAFLPIPEISSLFSLPPSSPGPHECIFGITTDPIPSIIHIHATYDPSPALSIQSNTTLPLNSPLSFILPVDPMAWSAGSSGAIPAHDVLLSVAQDGELMFWVPGEATDAGWRSTGRVRTGRTKFSRARCSSAKKTALVVPGPDGEELTIWDSKESEFASGLEFTKFLSSSDPVNDLDWSSTPDNQSILAVGFAYRVELLCQQRMTYFDEDPGWGVLKTIEIGNILPHSIRDSIWLTHGSLLIGSGHQMLLYGQPQPVKGAEPPEGLFEHVARLNGPLEDYHPQMLLQCLLWEKLELVKEIIVNLARDLERFYDLHDGKFKSTPVAIDPFLRKGQLNSTETDKRLHRRKYSSLFEQPAENDEPDDEGFSRDLVDQLMERLEANPLPHLTPNEQAHLLVLIQATLEVDESRRALDANGLRYLISMRSFYILNLRVTSPSSPVSQGSIARKTGWRERLRYRDMIWAFHSESQGLLLTASSVACQNRMTWSDARSLGVFLWLTSLDAMKTQMEVIARNEYTAGDARDPTACSLFYFALGKHKLVHGLWRQAAWHKEQNVMLKFLSNDFSDARYRTVALKNAFALLSKRRFEYAAAFFILGGSLKDAVNVCLRQLNDFQLAVALCRVVEQRDDGPLLTGVLRNTVIPTAFRYGNRWLGSWAFWLLNRRDLAVRILVTPLQDTASSLDLQITEIGSSNYDDPSLALLFSQLKSKTLQTAMGTSEISGRLEFNFVLQMARVFVRMGCHVLALDLVRSWSFDRPSTVVREPPTRPAVPPSPTSPRRMFVMEPALRRRSSIMIDMDVSSAPPTRHASPEPGEPEKIVLTQPPETIKEEGDLLARKAGLGSLMKSAKQDVNVPEFDMNAFF